MLPHVPQIHFVDRPEVSETFADFVKGISFDGQTMRIEFCVTRMDEPKPPEPQTGRQYPVCRLVLAPAAGIQLFNQLQHILNALEQKGVIKRETEKTPMQ